MLDPAVPSFNTTSLGVCRDDFGRVLAALEQGAPNDALVMHIQRLVHAFPAMGLALLEALAPHFAALSRDAMHELWNTALRNSALHYPQQAQWLLALCLKQAQDDPGVVLEDLMLLRGGEQQARAFKLCHARADLIQPGSGRRLAGRIAMRALCYPIVDCWVFTEAPLVAILEHEPAPGFQVAVGGGHLPWLAAWVMAVRSVGNEAHDVGIRATFDHLVAAGADPEEDVPGGRGGLALALACDGVDAGDTHAALAVELLMEAGANWTQLGRCAGSDSDVLLHQWPQVRRDHLGQVTNTETTHPNEAPRLL